MRFVILFLFILCGGCSDAKEPIPLTSCFSFEMNRIDKETGKFVLRNVFSQQLFNNLETSFPEHQIDWTAWTTNVNEYKGEDGKEKTELKGCFDITEISENDELISSIMRMSTTRFQAATKFYSKSNSEFIEQDKVDSMLDGYEEILRDHKTKEALEEVKGNGT